MLSNFNFGIGSEYQCNPSIDFEFTCSGTTCSGTTSSGFEFKSYDVNFPSEYYTGSYEFLFGIVNYRIHYIFTGSDSSFTSVAAGNDYFATTTSGTEFDVKPSVPELLETLIHNSYINDIALIGY